MVIFKREVTIGDIVWLIITTTLITLVVIGSVLIIKSFL